MKESSALELYKMTKTGTAVDDASPHQLIAMLFDGALERVASAMGAMKRKEPALVGESLSKAISIVDHLQLAIDHEIGGEMAHNLSALYDYITRRMLEANVVSDVSLLQEVSTLLAEVRLAWDQVPTEFRAVPG